MNQVVTKEDVGKRAWIILREPLNPGYELRATGIIKSITEHQYPDGSPYRMWCVLDTGNGGTVSGPMEHFFLEPAAEPIHPQTHTPTDPHTSQPTPTL